MLPCNQVWLVHPCGSLDYDVNIFSHVVQVPGLHVLVLQVFTDVAPRTENTVCFLMDLPLLIVTLRLRNHIPGEENSLNKFKTVVCLDFYIKLQLPAYTLEGRFHCVVRLLWLTK